MAPDNSPGESRFSNNLTLNSGATSVFEINGLTRGTQYDGVDVVGQLTYGGTHSLMFGAPIQAGTYNLFDSGSQTGTFSSVSIGGTFAEALIGSPTLNAAGWSALSASWNYDFDYTTGELLISAVPEPSSFAALAGLGAIAWAVGGRRRRAVTTG